MYTAARLFGPRIRGYMLGQSQLQILIFTVFTDLSNPASKCINLDIGGEFPLRRHPAGGLRGLLRQPLRQVTHACQVVHSGANNLFIAG